MSKPEPFDPLLGFAEIERLVAKSYFYFSHHFLVQSEVRGFRWEITKEKELIMRALEQAEQDRKEAAELLDVSLSSLYRKIEELEIS